MSKKLIELIEAAPGESFKDKLRACVEVSTGYLAHLVGSCEEIIGTLNPERGVEFSYADPDKLSFLHEATAHVEAKWKDDFINWYGQEVVNNEPFKDLFSDIYSARVYNRLDRKGQFFTPDKLSDAVAQMYYATSQPDPRKLFRLSDPCCGCGSMVLSFLANCHNNLGSNFPGFEVNLNDKDPLCATISVMQVFANMCCHQVEIGSVKVWSQDMREELLFKNAGLLYETKAFARIRDQ